MPDGEGRPALVVKLIQRLRLRVSPAVLLVSTTAVLLSAALLPIAVFSLLRISGHTAPAYDRYPYPTVKVYDPYGDRQRAGRPGPFYR